MTWKKQRAGAHVRPPVWAMHKKSCEYMASEATGQKAASLSNIHNDHVYMGYVEIYRSRSSRLNRLILH